MKLLSTLALIALANAAQAIPVMNENVANSGLITIYADHVDAHHFYVVPNVVMIAKGANGKPVFSYTSIRKGLLTETGVMQMAVVPAFTNAQLAEAEAGILKKDPHAQFSGLPFVESKLSLTGELQELISDNECDHPAGLVGQEQACTLLLTPKGRQLFLQSVAKKNLFTTLQFDYSVQGVYRKADGSFGDETIHQGMAIEIDGSQLAHYPELISR